MRQSYWIIAASCIALVALLLFQLNWLNQSRKLVEEQFDQKVTMALGSLGEVISEQVPEDQSINFLCSKEGVECGTGYLETGMEPQNLKKLLDSTLNQYAIDLDYRFEIVPVSTNSDIFFPTVNKGYSCIVGPNADLMKINFLGRDDYVNQKLGWMTLASILLMLILSFFLILTARQLLKQERLNQKNVDFFNNMAHEFRTPLTNMRLAMNLLLRKKAINPDNQYIGILKDENTRLLQQVERMLQISKFEQQDFMLDPKLFSLSDLLTKISTEMNLQAEAKSGRIELFPPVLADISIYGDALHISNAIRNLIDNAIKYCDSAPHIQIRLSQEGAYARLELKDNGVGIETKHQQSIFTKFFRIKNNQSLINKGFGLGLTYVKQVIDLHKGQLTIDSIPNRGSTFFLSFPIQNPST